MGRAEAWLHGGDLVVVDADANQATIAQVAHRHGGPGHSTHEGPVVETARSLDLEVALLVVEREELLDLCLLYHHSTLQTRRR